MGWAMQFWVPASMQERFDPGGYKLEDRGARWIEGFVRLKPGVTPAQAQAEISAVAKRLETDYPATNRGRGIKLFPLWQTPFNNAGTLLPTLCIALAVVVFVLLIACANVSNLLLVRAFGRRHEMTVRLAVGAGRGRLLKQLLTEGLILSALAAAGGLLVANWCRNLLVLLLPARGGVTMTSARRNRLARARVERRRLPDRDPAVRAGARDSDQQDRSGLRPESRIRRRGGWTAAGAGAIEPGPGAGGAELRSAGGRGPAVPEPARGSEHQPRLFHRRACWSPGSIWSRRDTIAQRARNFEDELIDRLQGLGGVQSAAFARMAPFSYRSYSSAPIAVDGYQTAPDEQPTVDYNEVGPGYFATMGIPLVSGREFTRADNETAPLVAVVNEAMAAQYWRGQDPVGRRLQVKGRWMQVVGVARMSKYRNLTETPQAVLLRAPAPEFPGSSLDIRTALAPEAMAKALVARDPRARREPGAG